MNESDRAFERRFLVASACSMMNDGARHAHARGGTIGSPSPGGGAAPTGPAAGETCYRGTGPGTGTETGTGAGMLAARRLTQSNKEKGWMLSSQLLFYIRGHVCTQAPVRTQRASLVCVCVQGVHGMRCCLLAVVVALPCIRTWFCTNTFLLLR